MEYSIVHYPARGQAPEIFAMQLKMGKMKPAEAGFRFGVVCLSVAL